MRAGCNLNAVQGLSSNYGALLGVIGRPSGIMGIRRYKPGILEVVFAVSGVGVCVSEPALFSVPSSTGVEFGSSSVIANDEKCGT